MEYKTFWWILDEWGCMNFFDSVEAFHLARGNIHGLMYHDTSNTDSFQAIDVKDCWKMEDILKWERGYEKQSVQET